MKRYLGPILETRNTISNQNKLCLINNGSIWFKKVSMGKLQLTLYLMVKH